MIRRIDKRVTIQACCPKCSENFDVDDVKVMVTYDDNADLEIEVD